MSTLSGNEHSSRRTPQSQVGMFAAAIATLRLDPARTKMISGFIDTYLKLNAQEEEIFKTEIAKFEPVQQEVVMEIVTSWMEEGRQEGRQEGELAVIMRLLNRRIGTLEPELQERIRQLRLNQLEDLAEALLDFSNAEDLQHIASKWSTVLRSKRQT